jgi:hypothetical protein
MIKPGKFSVPTGLDVPVTLNSFQVSLSERYTKYKNSDYREWRRRPLSKHYYN